MIEPVVAAFILTLLSEIADKTQLVIWGLALNINLRLRYFPGPY